MRRISILFFAIIVPFICRAQTITIDECYRLAQTNYPLIKQYNLIEKSKEYNISNAGKGYLPQIALSAQATYQSDVTSIPIDLSQLGLSGTIPSLSKDQYGVTVEVSQTIWDGGVIKAYKESAETNAEADAKNLETNLYNIKERINQIYFCILLADAQIKQNDLLQSQLVNICNKITAYVKNGVANQSDLDAVNVDLLTARQNRTKLGNAKQAYTKMLSVFIGKEIDKNNVFVTPNIISQNTGPILRPELEMYDAQIKNIESKNKQINSNLMPKFGIFVRGGYGKPGLNMLNDNFKAYYVGGIKMSWNFGNFYSNKNNKRLIADNIKSVEIQREIFLFNTKLDIAQKQSEIDSYREQLKYDDEIISLRTSIRQASEAKIAGGTISGTDLTRDINAEQTAIQNKIIHRTEILLAIYNLQFTTNN